MSLLAPLAHGTYARLFAAQVVALLGTGLLTVGLSLLAYDLAGAAAGTVLGTALAIKMIAYVGLAPIANALAEHLPRKALLIGADGVRAAVALTLPFIDSIWQIYVLIFVLQAASATFTPAFQALIPEILTEERDYTRALSLSRLAYDLENLLSPTLAGLLLLVISYHGLFVGTVAGFIGSALLVAASALPARRTTARPRPFRERLTGGVRIYIRTPRLRGLLALSLAAAAAGAFVIVNTVVLVRAGYGAGETGVAMALAAFGGGSMLAAFALPRLLNILSDRTVMAGAALTMGAALAGFGIVLMGAGAVSFALFLCLWAGAGALYASILTPSGRLLRRSAQPEDLPAVFAAQFALSHACWLVTYPLAGWGGDLMGMPLTLLLLGGIAAAGALLGLSLWPADDTDALAHAHPDLPENHPHLAAHGGGRRHRHVFVIDDLHGRWPA